MILAIIQARMGSTRLPAKALKEIAGIPSLEHVIRRVKQAKMLDRVILATTMKAEDGELTKLADANDISWYRGEEDDVLARFSGSAMRVPVDYIIRITGDCIFLDPFWIDLTCEYLIQYDPKELVYIHNIEPRRLPDGLDVEGFTFGALLAAHRNCDNAYDREHVCHWMMDNCKTVSLSEDLMDMSHHRWVLDTEADYEFFTAVAEHLDCTPPYPTVPDLQNFLAEHPEIMEINQ